MQKKDINFYTLIGSAIILLLGCTVIFGWYTDNTSLIQVNSAFAPMQYNTALGFVFTSIGAIYLVFQGVFFVRLLGVLVSVIGMITLVEYIAEINVGLDQLFMDHTIMTKTSHPGRMAPITALCFSLCGLALFLGTKTRATLISLSAAVLALAGVALMGYLVDQESLYGWGNLTRMAIHTTLGFIIISSSMICYGVMKKGETKLDAWELAPFLIGTIATVITIFSWYSATEVAHTRNKEYFNILVTDTQNALQNRFALYEQSLWGGLGLFYASDIVDRSEWSAYVKAIDIDVHLLGISGIGYIDYVLSQDLPAYLQEARNDNSPDFINHPDTFYPDKFIIKFIEPLANNKAALGLDIGFEANRRAAAERARDLGIPALTKRIELVQDQGKQPGFLLLVPVYDIKNTPPTLEERRRHFSGWVYAPFVGSEFMNGLTEISKGQLDFDVYDGARVSPEALIYSSAGTARLESQHTTHIKIAGRTWTVLWHETPLFSPPTDESIPMFVFGFGMVLTFLLYLMLSRLVRQKHIISREVEIRTMQLRAAKLEAERANAMKSEFLANMSHELRTPLNGVIGASDLLKETPVNDKQKNYIDIVNFSGTRLLNLINDILDLSKIEAGEVTVNCAPIVLEGLVQHTVKAFAPQALEKDLDLEIRYSPDIPYLLMIDELHLEQILTNLLGNAIKFTDKGCILLSVNLLEKTDTHVRLKFSVTDNGIGIAPDKIGGIFDKFSQIDSSTTKEYKGTGLGLTISKQLVELMDGQIGVKSKTGEGSVFWFELNFDIVNTLKNDEEFAAFSIFGKRVLVAINNPIKQETLFSYLESWSLPSTFVNSLSQLQDTLDEAIEDGKPYDVMLLHDSILTPAIRTIMKTIKDGHDHSTLKTILIRSNPETDISYLAELEFSEEIISPDVPSMLFDALARVVIGKKVETRAPEEEPEKFLTGKHVLLVEDESVNQIIARAMLEEMGCTVSVANNGKIAVDMAFTQSYDIIFMDCSMPVMDGYEATGEIRKNEKVGGEHQFIVAMTANALEYDREKCISAGMDDYLVKPIRKKTLEESIKQWLFAENNN